jgi:tetratricopeptide (TPR) repeat protein
MQAAEEADNDDERADVLNLFAEAYLGQQDWTTALGYLQEALEIANVTENMGTIATVGTNLGRVYLETGDIENARTQIGIAAETRPNDSVIVILLARLAAADGDNAEALRIMDVARGSSGEKWTDADDRLLESYRLAVAAEAERDTETE